MLKTDKSLPISWQIYFSTLSLMIALKKPKCEKGIFLLSAPFFSGLIDIIANS
jgi:hypothetical protein